jgi:hypothetical protein
VTERAKISDEEKEQYTKEHDASKREKGNAAAPTGGLGSRRSEVSSHLACRSSEHKKQPRLKPGLDKMHLQTRNIHGVFEDIVRLP